MKVFKRIAMMVSVMAAIIIFSPSTNVAASSIEGAFTGTTANTSAVVVGLSGTTRIDATIRLER